MWQYVASYLFHLIIQHQDPPIFLGQPVICLFGISHTVLCYHMNTLPLSIQSDWRAFGLLLGSPCAQRCYEASRPQLQAWEFLLGLFWRIKLLSCREWECFALTLHPKNLFCSNTASSGRWQYYALSWFVTGCFFQLLFFQPCGNLRELFAHLVFWNNWRKSTSRIILSLESFRHL